MTGEIYEKDLKTISNMTGIPMEMVKIMSSLSIEQLEDILDKWNNLKGELKIDMGEASLLEALTIYGYSRKELKALTIKFGDVGSTAEFVMKNKKQKNIGDFFG